MATYGNPTNGYTSRDISGPVWEWQSQEHRITRSVGFLRDMPHMLQFANQRGFAIRLARDFDGKWIDAVDRWWLTWETALDQEDSLLSPGDTEVDTTSDEDDDEADEGDDDGAGDIVNGVDSDDGMPSLAPTEEEDIPLTNGVAGDDELADDEREMYERRSSRSSSSLSSAISMEDPRLLPLTNGMADDEHSSDEEMIDTEFEPEFELRRNVRLILQGQVPRIDEFEYNEVE